MGKQTHGSPMLPVTPREFLQKTKNPWLDFILPFVVRKIRLDFFFFLNDNREETFLVILSWESQLRQEYNPH
jgi:hypothetical protein